MKNLPAEEELYGVLEQKKTLGVADKSNAGAADVAKEISSLRMILVGVFACFYLGEVVTQFLVIAAAGSLLLFLGLFRLRKGEPQFRAALYLAAVQMIWRIALVVSSYIPHLQGNTVLVIAGYAAAAFGVVQLFLLHRAFVKTEWLEISTWIPSEATGYLVLVVLNLLGGLLGDIVFIEKVAIAALATLYLYHIYRNVDIENA